MFRCLVTNLGHRVIAKFQGDWKDIFQYSVAVIDLYEFVQLSGDGVPDSPFLWVFLQYQKHINQILFHLAVEDLHELGQVLDGSEFQVVVGVLQDVVQALEQTVLGLFLPNYFRDLVETIGEGLPDLHLGMSEETGEDWEEFLPVCLPKSQQDSREGIRDLVEDFARHSHVVDIGVDQLEVEVQELEGQVILVIGMGEGELGDVKGEDFMGVDFHQFVPILEQREQLVRNNPSLLDIPGSGLDRGNDLHTGFPHSPRVLRALLLKERQHFLFKKLI